MTPGETVLVGVSGGADSLALLDLTARAAPSLGIVAIVAHLDHGWRDDSADDARFVAAEAERLDLRAIVERVELPDRSEATARAARLSFFARSGAAAVLLGHTADDQAETVLLHLLRGSGAQGLGGMRMTSTVEVEGRLLRLLRPLLGMRRADLRGYCAARGLAPREDASNADLSYARNRVRAELLPAAERVAPDATPALARAAAILADDADYLAATARQALAALGGRLDGARSAVSRRELVALPVAVQRAVLREIAAQLIGPASELSLERVEAARAVILRGRGGAVVQWPGFVDVRVERGEVIFERRR